jgi:hypothetical protein
MAGLVPAIHAFTAGKTWMPATSAGMTSYRLSSPASRGLH